MLGRRLEHEATGWRDAKALLLLVADAAGDWTPAGQLADALGVPPDLQRNAYDDFQRWQRETTTPANA